MTNNPINRPVALVTGGTRGIGFSCAEHLAKAGHDLALNGVRNEDQVLDTLSQLKEHGIDAIYCQIHNYLVTGPLMINGPFL